MLIEMNIIIPKKINIIVSQSKVIINNYKISMLIEVRIKDRPISHSVYIKKSIIIPSHFQAQLAIHHASLLDQDYFFESEQLDLTLFAHFIDSSLSAILIRNNSN